MQFINDGFTIAAYQGPAIYGNQSAALKKVIDILNCSQNIDILLFPEVFLHGYFRTEQDARANALNLKSDEFQKLLLQFSGCKTTVILGLNEIAEDKIYNTAVVIEGGVLVGRVRKAITYPPYDYYSLEAEYPVFYKNGIGFGICICCDINNFIPAYTLCKNGAQIIFCPMWNIIERTHSLVPYIQNKAHLIARAQENYAWFVGSDVTLVSDAEIGMGSSCIIDPLGSIVATGQVLTENIITYRISSSTLDPKRKFLDRATQSKKMQMLKLRT